MEKALPGVLSSTSIANSSVRQISPTRPFLMGVTSSDLVGANPGAPVTPAYKSPFEFTGTIHSVTFDVSGDVIRDTEAEMRIIMARQ
jgi:hypothetical protein